MFDYEKYRTSEGAWLAFRRQWLSANPPLDNGHYLCGICGGWVAENEVTLDHIAPRSAENIYRLSNIQPAHGACNYRKGSKRWEPVVTRDTYDFLRTLSDL